MMLRLFLILSALFISFISPAIATNKQGSFVDENGVLRWKYDNSEIKAFGVNYSLPFSHAYRMANRLGVNHEDAIKQDIYHFARLDLDLYRVHVWDTEISDTLGNLLQNEHLRLFDFAINEMKKREMKFVITPIAYWGNGWPERDFDTPGFSNKYGKGNCLTIPEAIEAQENYLFQFLNHVNPYTGIAYKDDPDIIAFEISNEPHHSGSEESVTEFINRLSSAMRRTGTLTPIFYNMSHSIQFINAYLKADVQGGTFQWYPAGLVANYQLNGNFLPHVAHYHIPFADNPDFKKTAKLVYEFDAADVGGNYIYPAMARSFREAGLQIAAHFDYDAMFLAPYNTNYGTHYMSLPYAPQKALSLKIASAVFHEIPLYSDFGEFPLNNNFGDFRIDYTNDLVEFVSAEKFFYSNNTSSMPEKPEELIEIAGYGSSPLISYEGKGAYFLDKIAEDSWRLEVMPDAYWLGDPYARVSPRRQVAAVNHQHRKMTINLPQLGGDFLIKALGDNKLIETNAIKGSFELLPGVYLLQRKASVLSFSPYQSYKNILLNEFVAPQSNLNDTLIKNFTALEATANQPLLMRFEVISPMKPEKVELLIQGSRRNFRSEVKNVGGDFYELFIEGDITRHGIVDYFLILHYLDEIKTFPSGLSGTPGDWDFYDHSTYSLRFLPPSEALELWNANSCWDTTLKEWNSNVSLKPLGHNNAVLHINIKASQGITDDDFLPDYIFKYYFGEKINGRVAELDKKSLVMIKVFTAASDKQAVKLGLIDKNGIAYSASFDIEPGKDIYSLPLSSFKQDKLAIVPRSFPWFMPQFHEGGQSFEFKPEDIEMLQFSVKEGMIQNLDLYIEKIWMY